MCAWHARVGSVREPSLFHHAAHDEAHSVQSKEHVQKSTPTTVSKPIAVLMSHGKRRAARSHRARIHAEHACRAWRCGGRMRRRSGSAERGDNVIDSPGEPVPGNSHSCSVRTLACHGQNASISAVLECHRKSSGTRAPHVLQDLTTNGKLHAVAG